MKKLSYIFIIFVLILSVFLTANKDLEAKSKSKKTLQKKNTKSAKIKSKSNKKNVKKSQLNKSKSIKKTKIKKVKYPALQTNREIDLGDGMIYKNLFIGNGYSRFSVHILETELNDKNKAFVLKGSDHIDDLERLHDMINRNDSINEMKVFGATNANFWKAYSNLPIGPTIKNGEVIQMRSYKEWSCAFWDEKKVVIDNFVINGLLQNKYGQWKEISYVNTRRDTSGLVFYNKYGGDTIPYMSSKEYENTLLQIKKEILNETYQKDSLETEDSTEAEFDVALLQKELLEEKRFEKIEYSMKKLRLKLIDQPSLNADLKYIVLSEENGTTSRPQNGAIISLGSDFNLNDFKYQIGDTVVISFNTKTYSNRKFLNGICGTPRLVRSGIANHEATKEGSKGRRFVSKPLPRTAIGTDKDGSKLYIVAIESNSRSNGITGANLKNMSTIMKKIGCYDAMNLDGGGSTVMVVNGKNVTSRSRPEYSRKISVGIGIGKKKENILGNNSGE